MMKKSVWLQIVEFAAEKGNALAQRVLGDMYIEGTEIEKDEQKAFFWYQKSAAQGDKSGMLALGMCYAYGMGVEQSPQDARLWTGRACKIEEDK
ncbi:MAG: sel1 repeat family protein [Clostridia bacterium]|nr:sel1 repeat family protein [Clostridia bacterium]